MPGARARAERGELAFGTIDSFLLWRLTGGAVHATDATNAVRTLLFDIHRQAGTTSCCRCSDVPARAAAGGPRQRRHVRHAPRRACSGASCRSPAWPATSRRRCSARPASRPAWSKSTYGTGCFVLLNTGERGGCVAAIACSRRSPVGSAAGRPTRSRARSSSPARRSSGCATGSELITQAAETDAWPRELAGQSRRLLGPGIRRARRAVLGPHARGAIFGLTRDATGAHLARAALEAVAYQTLDLSTRWPRDGAAQPAAMRIDGGMAANDWLCQFLADIVQLPVERPQNVETTALGAAFLAGLAVGVWDSLDDLSRIWKQRDGFAPAMAVDRRERLVRGWRSAVANSGALADLAKEFGAFAFVGDERGKPLLKLIG